MRPLSSGAPAPTRPRRFMARRPATSVPVRSRRPGTTAIAPSPRGLIPEWASPARAAGEGCRAAEQLLGGFAPPDRGGALGEPADTAPVAGGDRVTRRHP